MRKRYVRSLKEYDESFDLDIEKIVEAAKHYKSLKKSKPIGVNLDKNTVALVKASW